METLYFTLGIAFVVVAAVAVGAVWAMVKVAKLNSMLRDVEQQFTNTHRDITMVEKTIMNNIGHNNRDTDQRFNDLYTELANQIDAINLSINSDMNNCNKQFDEVHRYIDSRIDKLISKQEKQVLKD